MRVAGTRGKRRVVSLLLVLLLAHLLLLLLILLLLHKDSSSESPPTAAATGSTTVTPTVSRIPGSPSLEGSPCVGVGGGRKWAWQPVYTVVIDAGATATRAHVFSFLRCCLDNTFMLQNEDYFHQDDTILHYVNASSQIRFLLVPLLRRARSVVPPEYHPHTPLIVRATPSLRLLPRPDATTLIHTARKIVTGSGFLVKRGHVTIMAGHDEAADLWLAANFLTGRLYQNQSSPLATADLGGGTLQVTVPLSGPPDHIKKAIMERREREEKNRRAKGEPKKHAEGPDEFIDSGDSRSQKPKGVSPSSSSSSSTPSSLSTNGSSRSSSSRNTGSPREGKSSITRGRLGGGRRISEPINRRLKHNLNNNSSHELRGEHDKPPRPGEGSPPSRIEVEREGPPRPGDDFPPGSEPSRTGILEDGKPFRTGIPNDSESYLTGIPEDSEPSHTGISKDSESHKTTSISDVESTTPISDERQILSGEEKDKSERTLPVSSISSSSVSSSGNLSAALPRRPGRKKRRRKGKKRGGMRGRQNLTSGDDAEIQSPESHDTFAFQVLSSGAEKIRGSPGPNLHEERKAYDQDDVGMERKTITDRTKVTSESGIGSRRQRGREAKVDEHRRGGKRRSQRGDADDDDGDDEDVHQQKKSSASQQIFLASREVKNSSPRTKSPSSHSPSEAPGDFPEDTSKLVSTYHSHRRKERKRKVKKPTRRKPEGRRRKKDRKPDRRGKKRKRKEKVMGEVEEEPEAETHLRWRLQTPSSTYDRQQLTDGGGVSSPHNEHPGSVDNPLNVGHGAAKDNRGSDEISPSILLEKPSHSMEGDRGVSPPPHSLSTPPPSSQSLSTAFPPPPSNRSIVINNNDREMEGKNHSSNSRLNIPGSLSSATWESNHQGNHTNRQRGQSRRRKTPPVSEIESSTTTFPALMGEDQAEEVTWGREGEIEGGRELPLPDKVSKHDFIRLTQMVKKDPPSEESREMETTSIGLEAEKDEGDDRKRLSDEMFHPGEKEIDPRKEARKERKKRKRNKTAHRRISRVRLGRRKSKINTRNEKTSSHIPTSHITSPSQGGHQHHLETKRNYSSEKWHGIHAHSSAHFADDAISDGDIYRPPTATLSTERPPRQPDNATTSPIHEGKEQTGDHYDGTGKLGLSPTTKRYGRRQTKRPSRDEKEEEESVIAQKPVTTSKSDKADSSILHLDDAGKSSTTILLPRRQRSRQRHRQQLRRRRQHHRRRHSRRRKIKITEKRLSQRRRRNVPHGLYSPLLNRNSDWHKDGFNYGRQLKKSPRFALWANAPWISRSVNAYNVDVWKDMSYHHDGDQSIRLLTRRTSFPLNRLVRRRINKRSRNNKFCLYPNSLKCSKILTKERLWNKRSERIEEEEEEDEQEHLRSPRSASFEDDNETVEETEKQDKRKVKTEKPLMGYSSLTENKTTDVFPSHSSSTSSSSSSSFSSNGEDLDTRNNALHFSEQHDYVMPFFGMEEEEEEEEEWKALRTKRELRNLFDAPNITSRCSPSKKYWLFASSVAMGIYPARVKVLQSGNILRLTPPPTVPLTTPSPPTATTSHHRSDIPPEEEYPELGIGYRDPDLSESDDRPKEDPVPIPAPPPPVTPKWPTSPSVPQPTPPVRITSQWMENTLAKVKGVVDSILKSIGSRDDTLNDDGKTARIDVEFQRGEPTVKPSESRKATPHRRKPGRRGHRRSKGAMGRRRAQKGVKSPSEHSSDSLVPNTTVGGKIANEEKIHQSVDDSVDMITRKTNSSRDSTSERKIGSSRRSTTSATVAVPSRTLNSSRTPAIVSKSGSQDQTKPSVHRQSTVVSNSTSTFLNDSLSVPVSHLDNATVASHINFSGVNNVNNSSLGYEGNVSSQVSAATNSSSKKTLSSVTDLLFTVPNVRVINPSEDSAVKSEIKSTEQLIRTSLEDLLFRVPGSKQPSEKEAGGVAKPDTAESGVLPQDSTSEGHLRGDLPQTESHPSKVSSTESSGHLKNDGVGASSGDVERERLTTTIENEELWSDSSTQQRDLILRTACLPVGSIGRFKVQDATYLVTGLGAGPDGQDCWREVSSVVKKHIKLPPMNHTTLLATTAFYFVAASANLIEPDMAYGFVRVEQFKIAANIMCQKAAEQLPDPLACLDYQYVAALLSEGLQLPDHTEILVCEKIRGFRLGWALGAALNYLQKH